jgi:hypothetical protein
VSPPPACPSSPRRGYCAAVCVVRICGRDLRCLHFFLPLAL